MKKKGIAIEKLLYLVGAIFITIGLIGGIYQQMQKQQHDQTMDSLRVQVKEDIVIDEKKISKDEYQSPYEDIFVQNKDCVAWLKIPGTKVDYPVMHTPDEEDYYLYKNYYGEADKNGCLILASFCDMEKNMTNTLIHGHNMKSGEMFGDLDSYKDMSFATEHKSIDLYTKEQEKHYEVIAAFYGKVLSVDEEGFRYYQFFQAKSEEEFDEFIANIEKLNLYNSEITATYGDELITLSTCSNVGKEGRFVVIGKRVD